MFVFFPISLNLLPRQLSLLSAGFARFMHLSTSSVYMCEAYSRPGSSVRSLTNLIYLHLPCRAWFKSIYFFFPRIHTDHIRYIRFLSLPKCSPCFRFSLLWVFLWPRYFRNKKSKTVFIYAFPPKANNPQPEKRQLCHFFCKLFSSHFKYE